MEYTLTLQKFFASVLVNDEALQGATPQVNLHMNYQLERLAYLLAATMRVPGEVVQDRQVVAEYPASLWDHILKTLRLPHRKVVKRLNEILLYPTVQAVPGYGDTVRLHTMEYTQMFDPNDFGKDID